jgi:hypothetical protein
LKKCTAVEGEVDEIICIAEASWNSSVFKVVNLHRWNKEGMQLELTAKCLAISEE